VRDAKLKDMVKYAEALAMQYHNAKIKVMLHDKDHHELGKDIHQVNVQFIAAFHYVLQLMVPENRSIIVNDFILRKQYNWWLDFYTRSTYYRLKSKALKELLHFFDV
jgi:hypothetical protein